MRRLRVIGLAGLALGLLLTGPGAGARTAAAGRTGGAGFYVPPSPMAKKPRGTIIRSRPIAAPADAKAWKVLYHSRSVDGDDIAVSGVVVAPTGAAPNDGRTVVTWAHGTTGLADQCAPSKAADAATAIPFVDDLLQAGYVVTATDYEGLGTPRVHPYLVGESEGRSVLDAARAAKALDATGAGDRVLVAGHSQGGQAALFAGELAASYAPELDMLGVAVAAPAADVEQILPLAGTIRGGPGYVAMGMRGFHAAYPDVDPAAFLTPDALTKSQAATTQCSGEVMQAFTATTGSVLAQDPLSVASLRKLLHANSAGNRPAGAPLLVVQGTADTTIPQVLTDVFVKKSCAAGNTVQYTTFPGATHGSVIHAARADVMRWLTERAARAEPAEGVEAPSTCS